MKKQLLLAFMVLTGLNATAQDSLYFSRVNTIHAFPVDSVSITTNKENVLVKRTSGTETYSISHVDSMTFTVPSFYKAQNVGRTYFKETFSSSFGTFSVSTPSGLPWIIDYKTAKGTGYSNSVITAGSSYLLSQPIDLVRSGGVKLTFSYILRYVRSGVENKVLATDFYTGDPTTTEWTDLNVTLTQGSDWSTFSDATVQLPQRFIGCSHVVIAFYYSCTSAGSATWEIKNVSLTETDNINKGGDSTSTDSTNLNKNIVSSSAPYSWRLEYPHLHNGANDLVVVHKTDDLGVTYSLEWDCSKRAQRWTCFQFHNGLPNNNVKRNEDWKEDDLIPYEYRTHNSDYSGSGYSRGHMCASYDRQTSVEQNKQTFYLSNMQPQLSDHNAGIWLRLEQKVQDWGYHGTYRDTLYVVKGGTIDKEEDILAYTRTQMIVPRYFYMCLLAVKDGKYKAIGFWTKHEKAADNATITSFAKSIDEIEELTGIDFFCNLPDEIEAEVEKSYNLSDWGL